jgi:hypothetical protein
MLRDKDFVVGALAAGLASAATRGSVAFIKPVRGEKELTVNARDHADTDLVTLPSAHGVSATIERLKALLDQKKIPASGGSRPCSWSSPSPSCFSAPPAGQSRPR